MIYTLSATREDWTPKVRDRKWKVVKTFKSARGANRLTKELMADGQWIKLVDETGFEYDHDNFAGWIRSQY